MTVTSVVVATTLFLFGMCNCTVNNDVGTGDFSLVRGILHDRTCLRAWTGHCKLKWSLYHYRFLENKLNQLKTWITAAVDYAKFLLQLGLLVAIHVFFLLENHNFPCTSIFLTFPEVKPEIFLNFS